MGTKGFVDRLAHFFQIQVLWKVKQDGILVIGVSVFIGNTGVINAQLGL